MAEQLARPSEERLYFHAGDMILSMEPDDAIAVKLSDIREPMFFATRTAAFFLGESWPREQTETSALVLRDGQLHVPQRIPWPERLHLSEMFHRFTSISSGHKWAEIVQQETLAAVTGREASLMQV